MVVIDRPEDVASTSVVAILALGREGTNMSDHCDPPSIKSPFSTLPVGRGTRLFCRCFGYLSYFTTLWYHNQLLTRNG